MGPKKSKRRQARPAPRTAGAAPARVLTPELAAALQQAVLLHQSGRLSAAGEKYAQVLAAHPHHPDALNLRGLVAFQQGDSKLAVELIGKAVRVNRAVAEYHSNLGMAWRALGEYGKAIQSYGKALALSPNTPGLHYNLANALKDHGRLEEAVAAYQRALALDPVYPEGHNNLGVALKALGRREEALASHRRAVELRPDYPEGLNNLGTILNETGQTAEAVACFQRAVELDPSHHRAWYNLSSALIGLSRLEQAAAAARRALELKQDYTEAHNNLGVALNSLGQTDAAIAEYQRALALQPDYAEALSNLAMALTSRGRLKEAEARAREAIAARPDFAEAHNNLANALKDAGRLAEAFGHYRQAVDLKPDYAGAHSNLLMCLNYDPEIDEEGILTAHEQWDRQHGQGGPSAPARYANSPEPERPLRLGYISADFYRHTVSYYLLPVLAAHDRRRFQVFCYSARHIEDEVTRRLRAHSSQWRSVVGRSDDEVAEMIRADGIDILIDLSGHTAHNRLTVLARRPAPVQASWLGYFNTTGMRSVDYILMDAQTVPPGEERWFTEEVIRLPYGRFCYGPPEYAPAVAGPPCLGRGQVTFGSFNNLTKVTPQVVELWSRLLQRVAGSRLVLKWKTLADPEERERLWGMFVAQGLERTRVDLRPPTPHSQMLREYGDLDIGLDPFPFSGGVTSCEALWMGVPVVTLPGRRAVSRQTLGFLNALGLGELVAASPEEYLDIAARLAADPGRLAQLRAGLRGRMAGSPLCNGPLFTRALEEALRGLWRRWCAGAWA